MKASEVLTKAKERIEGGWCREAFCYTEKGGIDQADDIDTRAQAYCVEGALLATLNAENAEEYDGYCTTGFYTSANYLAEAIGIGGPYGLNAWNDKEAESKGQVLDAFDHAIKRALEDEAEADHA